MPPGYFYLYIFRISRFVLRAADVALIMGVRATAELVILISEAAAAAAAAVTPQIGFRGTVAITVAALVKALFTVLGARVTFVIGVTAITAAAITLLVGLEAHFYRWGLGLEQLYFFQAELQVSL